MRTLAVAGLAASVYVTDNATGQALEPDPAAAQAFAEIVKAWRAFPSLRVKTTVKIEATQGETRSSGSEAKAEFLFGPQNSLVAKLRGYTCYYKDGVLHVVHESTEHSYYTTENDSGYYALLTSFMDLPFPELGLRLGDEDPANVSMELHTRAPWIQPTDVQTEQRDGKPMTRVKLASEIETMEMVVDAETKLIQELEVKITGGDMVRDNAVLTYKYTYEYETFDAPLPEDAFTFDPAQRQRVDVLAALTPRPAAPQPDPNAPPGQPGHAAGPLVGKQAPGFVLSTADGKAVDLNDLRGRVVVIDFWASWCGPCMIGLPKVHQVAKWAGDQQLPVTILTINVWEIQDDNAGPEERLASARKTWEKRGFSLPILMDYSGETAAAYGVRGIPTTIVVRADGIVHAQHTGVMDEQVMKNHIQQALEAVALDG